MTSIPLSISILRRVSSHYLHSLQMVTQIQRSRQDKWDASPAQVTSHFQFSFSSWSSGSTYYSPTCGFGWRWQARINYSSHPNQAALNLIWEPYLCDGMSLSGITVSVQISGTGNLGGYQNSYKNWYMSDGSQNIVSGYTVNRHSQVEVVLSLLFDSSNGLCFPGPPSPAPQPRTKAFLLELMQASLRRPSPADTKLYLYSARVGHRAARPKPLFGSSNLLRNSATYWETMLSGTGFKHGVSCDLFADDPEVTRKLSSDDYDYGSDSDLESIADERDVGFEEKDMNESGELPVDEDAVKSKMPPSQPREPQHVKATGLAYAINGTAHRTMEAYIAYAYTDGVEFDPLRSTRRLRQSQNTRKNSNGDIRCSPKSMYRFADYAGIPALKAKAKTGIEEGLTKENIVTELFSSFTSRYDDIIELETGFLIKNFSDEVERAFNMVLHTKEYHSRTLIFALKRLRGGDVKAAWEMADYIAIA